MLFLGRIGVVESADDSAAELLRDAEIKGNRLGVADMHNRSAPAGTGSRFRGFLGVEVGLHDVADEIAPRLCRYRFCWSSGFPSRFKADLLPIRPRPPSLL